MKTIVTVLILAGVIVAGADDKYKFTYDKCRYWYAQQGIEADTTEIKVDANKGVFAGDEGLGPRPTAEQLASITEAQMEAWKSESKLSEHAEDLATLGELLTDSGLDINDYNTAEEVTAALHAKGEALRDAVAKAADYKAMQSAQVAYNAQLGRNSLLQIMFSQMSADASELVKLAKAAAVKDDPVIITPR